MKTLSITDYVIQSPAIAKIIISFTGEIDQDYIEASIASKTSYAASVVANSFKTIRPGVAVGFIRANKAVRAVSRKEISANYKVMSSNILMDNEDKTLWDVKEGAGGKYLARHGADDLTALVESAVTRRSDVPGVRHITIAKASPKELVAFVDAEGDMDYGFAIGSSEEAVKVVSFNRRIPVVASYDSVVSIQPVALPKETVAEVIASLTAKEKQNAVDYYTRLYGFAPEYLRQIIDSINKGTVA
jgi:hypothetical protein